MDRKEKLIKIIRKIIEKEMPPSIQIGVMTSENTIKVRDLEIDKSMLYFIETSTVNINTKFDMVGTVGTGGGGESPHSHLFSHVDKSTYINKLKAGDKIAVYRIPKGNYLVLGKIVSL